MPEPSAPKIYPELENVDAFRMQKIEDVRKEIQSERNKREKTYRKYKKIIHILSYSESVAEVAGMTAGSVGIAALAGGVTAPLGLVLEGIALGCGATSLALKYFNSKLKPKAKKHDEIRVLADSKLNSISDVISQAIEDGHIEQDEFKMITEEQKKFIQMKEEIRNKRVPNDIQEIIEKEKKELLQKLQQGLK